MLTKQYVQNIQENLWINAKGRALKRDMITGYPNGKYTNEEMLNFTVAKKLNVYISLPNSFIETLILNPLVFGDVAFGRRLGH